MGLTFEEFLELWNQSIYTQVSTFVLDELGADALSESSVERTLEKTLEWGLCYCHFFATESALVKFLKAISVRILFEDKNEDTKDIVPKRGELWNRALSHLSTNRRRTLRLLIDDAILETVLSAACVSTLPKKTYKAIYEALFARTISRLEVFPNAADALRDAMATELIGDPEGGHA